MYREPTRKERERNQDSNQQFGPGEINIQPEQNKATRIQKKKK